MQIRGPAVSVKLQLFPSFASISFRFVTVLLGMSYSPPRKPVSILVPMPAEMSGCLCNVLVQGISFLTVVNYQLAMWLKVLIMTSVIDVADFQMNFLLIKYFFREQWCSFWRWWLKLHQCDRTPCDYLPRELYFHKRHMPANLSPVDADLPALVSDTEVNQHHISRSGIGLWNNHHCSGPDTLQANVRLH